MFKKLFKKWGDEALQAEIYDLHERVIRHEDICWSYAVTESDTRHIFEHSSALAFLLHKGDVFIYSDKDEVKLAVNCNDVFAWACADAEDLPFSELKNLYHMVHKDPVWGAAKWCILRRKEMPQEPVLRDMKKRGSWDLDESLLEKNTMDDYVQAVFTMAARQQQEEGHL